MKTFAPEEISAMVLTKMKETAEAYLGKKVQKCQIIYMEEKSWNRNNLIECVTCFLRLHML